MTHDNQHLPDRLPFGLARGDANSEQRADADMGGAHGETMIARGAHEEGGGEIGGEPLAGIQIGDLVRHGVRDTSRIDPSAKGHHQGDCGDPPVDA